MLTTGFPRWRGDLFGSFVFELSRALVARGVEVVVVAPHEKGLPRCETLDGVFIKRFRYMIPTQWQRVAYGGGIPTNVKTGRLARLQVPLFLLGFWWRALWATRHSDVVHCHWTISGLVGYAATRLWRRPLLLTVRGSDMHLAGQGLMQRLHGWIYSRMATVVAVSADIAGRLVAGNVAASKVEIAYNGVDDRFQPGEPEAARRELGLPPESFIVLFVGLLVPVKGVDTLIASLPELAALLPASGRSVRHHPGRGERHHPGRSVRHQPSRDERDEDDVAAAADGAAAADAAPMVAGAAESPEAGKGGAAGRCLAGGRGRSEAGSRCAPEMAAMYGGPGVRAPRLLAVLVGDGPAQEALARQATALGVAGQVCFTGRQPSSTVQTWMQAADVLVLPSRSEGRPNVVLEAQACGLPVVATRVGGTPELVKDGDSGLLVEPDDPEALARAVGRLAGDAALRQRLGRNGWRRIQTHGLTWNASADKMLQLYQRALAGDAPQWTAEPSSGARSTAAQTGVVRRGGARDKQSREDGAPTDAALACAAPTELAPTDAARTNAARADDKRDKR